MKSLLSLFLVLFTLPCFGQLTVLYEKTNYTLLQKWLWTSNVLAGSNMVKSVDAYGRLTLNLLPGLTNGFVTWPTTNNFLTTNLLPSLTNSFAGTNQLYLTASNRVVVLGGTNTSVVAGGTNGVMYFVVNGSVIPLFSVSAGTNGIGVVTNVSGLGTNYAISIISNFASVAYVDGKPFYGPFTNLSVLNTAGSSLIAKFDDDDATFWSPTFTVNSTQTIFNHNAEFWEGINLQGSTASNGTFSGTFTGNGSGITNLSPGPMTNGLAHITNTFITGTGQGSNFDFAGSLNVTGAVQFLSNLTLLLSSPISSMMVRSNNTIILCTTNYQVGVGKIPANALDVSGTVAATAYNSATAYYWSGKSLLYSPADTAVAMVQNNGRGFNRLVLGSNSVATATNSVKTALTVTNLAGIAVTAQDGITYPSNLVTASALGLTPMANFPSSKINTNDFTYLWVSNNSPGLYLHQTNGSDIFLSRLNGGTNIFLEGSSTGLVINVNMDYVITAPFVEPTNATAYWRLDETGVNTRKNEVGALAWLTNSGTMTDTPGVGPNTTNAGLFDGSSYLYCYGDQGLEMSNTSFEIVFWVKFNPSARTEAILVKQDPGVITDYRITHDGGGTNLTFTVNNYLQDTESSVSLTGPLPTNTWYWVDCTFDLFWRLISIVAYETNQSAPFASNGHWTDDDGDFTGGIAVSSGQFQLSGDEITDYAFHGVVDELRIYKRLLFDGFDDLQRQPWAPFVAQTSNPFKDLTNYVDSRIIHTLSPPINNAAGSPGQMRLSTTDTNWVYFCVATNVWRRVALTNY